MLQVIQLQNKSLKFSNKKKVESIVTFGGEFHSADIFCKNTSLKTGGMFLDSKISRLTHTNITNIFINKKTVFFPILIHFFVSGISPSRNFTRNCTFYFKPKHCFQFIHGKK